MRRYSILFLLACGAALRVAAGDDHCTKDDTIPNCFAKIVPGTAGDTDAAAAAGSTSVTQKLVSAANTGISSQASPSQSTVKDFLSILSAAFDVPTDSSGSKPFSFDYNQPVPFFGGDEERLKFQAVLAKPDLSSQLTDRLTSNADAVKKLNDSLSQVDDATLSVSLSPSTWRLGRSITPHRDTYQDMLVAKLDAFDSDFKALDAMVLLLTSNGKTDKDIVATIGVLFPSDTDAKLAIIEDAARAEARLVATEFANKFALLLNNQPQFYATAIVHSRKDEAGPDEHSAKLTYEMGFNNLNAFYALNADCAVKATADCADRLVASAKANGADDDPANRVAFSAEYRVAREWVVDLPQYSINFSAPKAHTFIYSASWGRNSHSAVFGGKSGRIDVAVNYENSSVRNPEDVVPLQVPGLRVARVESAATAPVRDRLVASVTFTQKLSDTVSFPFSLVYANHASFLGTVDRKLNAHFGINYKLPGGS